jgi:hypothetical protein
MKKKNQKRKEFSPRKSNNVSVLLTVMNMLVQPLKSCSLWAGGCFLTEILTPAVMVWKCSQFFADAKRVVQWTPILWSFWRASSQQGHEPEITTLGVPLSGR